MLFNSIDFAIFLPIVFIAYWFIFKQNLKQQNFLVVVASYIFYGWWDWRFLLLIFVSTIIDFSIGQSLYRQENDSKRKVLLWISIFVNLGLLAYFKYFNFFLENFLLAFSLFGSSIKVGVLNIILPIGISFYTFQTLSYTIDVYRRKLVPTNDLISFAAFVSFFPQLVAGPIERATRLLPQFNTKRSFDYGKAVDGMRQILWGLFKKIVIADNCAVYANQIFNNSTDYSAGVLLLGALFFTFQIYGDFSGYSDIAIGTARLFGFNLTQNFAFPYFARDIAEFWRRWHISLSTWFRDYVYIPLGGSRGSNWLKVRNTFVIFLVSGLWHGANWTFIVWGGLNALYFIPLLLTNRNRKNLDVVAEGRYLPSINELLSMLGTFALTAFSWIFFRAENMNHAIQYINGIILRPYDLLSFAIPSEYIRIIGLISLFMLIEWLGRSRKYAIEKMPFPKLGRWSIYLLLGLSIFALGNFSETKFIYFAF